MSEALRTSSDQAKEILKPTGVDAEPDKTTKLLAFSSQWADVAI